MPLDVPFSVMSFNIRYGTAKDGPNGWEHRKRAVTAMLDRRRPRLLGLQETLSFQIEEIVAELPNYRYVGVGRDDGLKAGEYSPILYDAKVLDLYESGTFWLSDHPETPGSNDWGDSNVRICTWAHFHDHHNRPIRMFNTHLAFVSQLAREKGIALILERMGATHKNLPTVLSGDFNADEDNSCLCQLRESGFRDSYREIEPLGAAPTFNGFGDTYPDEKIDYIWVDPSIKVVGAEIVLDRVEDRWISDHFPITAEISLT